MTQKEQKVLEKLCIAKIYEMKNGLWGKHKIDRPPFFEQDMTNMYLINQYLIKVHVT